MKSKVILLASLVILGITSLRAQLNVGSTSAPNADAMLQVTSSSKGILFPLIALTSTTSPAPLTANVAGMMVYNTATTGDVVPGPYFNNGTKWIFFGVKVDPLFSALSTSQAAYTSATANTWVIVTAAEYANVLSTVPGAGAYGVPDATFNSAVNPGANFGISTVSVNQGNSTQLPANYYPIAMKVRTFGASAFTSQLKFGTTAQNNYNNYIGTTPSTTATEGATTYYVVKAPTANVPTVGYVGVFTSTVNTALSTTYFPGAIYYTFGDLANGANMALTNSDFQTDIQVLGTATKNW